MTDRELIVDLNTSPRANVLRFTSKGNDIDFRNNFLYILVFYTDSIKPVYHIFDEKHIAEFLNGNNIFIDLPLETNKNEVAVFLSSPTNMDLDEIEVIHTNR